MAQDDQGLQKQPLPNHTLSSLNSITCLQASGVAIAGVPSKRHSQKEPTDSNTV